MLYLKSIVIFIRFYSNSMGKCDKEILPKNQPDTNPFYTVWELRDHAMYQLKTLERINNQYGETVTRLSNDLAMANFERNKLQKKSQPGKATI